MTRFDEPHRAAQSLIASRPLVALVLVLLSAIATGAATVLVCAQGLVPVALGRAFVAHPIVVYATPTASRADVDALGDRLKALTVVERAVLRPKEEAMVALVQAGLPQASDGRNPLPDAWILHMRCAAGARTSFVTTATGLRDTIAALPGVDQVRFDARWNERLERWSDRWSRRGVPMIAVGLVMVVLAWGGLWFVARDALARPSVTTEGKRSLLPYVLAVVVVGTAGSGAALWFGGRLVVGGDALPIGTGPEALPFMGVLAGVAVIATVIAWASSRRSAR